MSVSPQKRVRAKNELVRVRVRSGGPLSTISDIFMVPSHRRAGIDTTARNLYFCGATAFPGLTPFVQRMTWNGQLGLFCGRDRKISKEVLIWQIQ